MWRLLAILSLSFVASVLSEDAGKIFCYSSLKYFISVASPDCKSPLFFRITGDSQQCYCLTVRDLTVRDDNTIVNCLCREKFGHVPWQAFGRSADV